MKSQSVQLLEAYIESLRPIIYIDYPDYTTVNEMISKAAYNAKIIEYDNAFGMIDFQKKIAYMQCTLEEFLHKTNEEGYDNNTFLVLKDVHEELSNPRIIAYLKRIAERQTNCENYYCTVFIISSIRKIPPELENYITVFDIPFPTYDDIRTIIWQFEKDNELEISDDDVDSIALSLKGMNELQISQILRMSYHNGGQISADDKNLIIKEKEQFIKKSGLLELVNFKESIDDIGGLDALKKWLNDKAKIFNHLDAALKYGVVVPHGIMIIGMPGCGKSLSAKVTASLFQIPLVRMDVGKLLGQYVGESENNMRRALKLAESISPCVLWIDEIEKAFAGIGGGDGGGEVTTRLFGQLLTWMQEKEDSVFIVATANDISKLPPEFLRKGRFDELFYVDLPNWEERRQILKIHLKKRHKYRENFNIDSLRKLTEGFNGADLEAAVNETIEKSFINLIDDESCENNKQNQIQISELEDTIKHTKSISSSLGEKIKAMKATLDKIDCKSASSIAEDK